MSLEAAREETVQLLCLEFANDAITTPELERRLEAAYRASSEAELDALTVGLPALRPEPRAERGLIRRTHAHNEDERRVLAVMASVKRHGDWEPGERTTAFSLMSELELDFREARIRPGVTTVRVNAMMSTVRIIVPPGLNVECDGSAIMGEFSAKTLMSADPADDAPTLRITGIAFMSEVKVHVRLPDETAVQALKREWLG